MKVSQYSNKGIKEITSSNVNQQSAIYLPLSAITIKAVSSLVVKAIYGGWVKSAAQMVTILLDPASSCIFLATINFSTATVTLQNLPALGDASGANGNAL